MESSLRGCVCERYAVACPQGRLHQDAVADPCSPLKQSFRGKCCFPIQVVIEAVGRLDSRLGRIEEFARSIGLARRRWVFLVDSTSVLEWQDAVALKDHKGRDEEVEVNDG